MRYYFSEKDLINVILLQTFKLKTEECVAIIIYQIIEKRFSKIRNVFERKFNKAEPAY